MAVSLSWGVLPSTERRRVSAASVMFPCPLGCQRQLCQRQIRGGKTAEPELENIKAQIGKHYQYLSDHDSFLTAKKVYDRYNGFGEEIHSLMEIFNIQIRDYKRQIGKTKAQKHLSGVGGRVQVSVLLPEGQVGYGGYPRCRWTWISSRTITTGCFPCAGWPSQRPSSASTH